MAYFVEFVAPVLDYLDRVSGLTDDARRAIVDGIVQELSTDADRFWALYPLAHESHCFWYDYPHAHDGMVYDLRFVIDASHAEVGVMRVAYVEGTILSSD